MFYQRMILKKGVVGADDTLIESNVAERPVGQDITPPNVDVEITAKGEIHIIPD